MLTTSLVQRLVGQWDCSGCSELRPGVNFVALVLIAQAIL